MEHFLSDDIEIAYLDVGGDTANPVVLIHGFASTSHVNWVNPGWVDVLSKAGHRVIAMDNRGHGMSAKPYVPDMYPAPTMSDDVWRLLDHLRIERADVVGYSMGARIAAFLSIRHPDRVDRMVLGGVGGHLLADFCVQDNTMDVVAALEAKDIGMVTTEVGRSFRKFADANNADLRALSACIKASRTPLRREDLATIRARVLVAAGSLDEVSGPVEALVSCIPGARRLDIPDRDHMRAVGDLLFKEQVVRFLQRD